MRNETSPIADSSRKIEPGHGFDPLEFAPLGNFTLSPSGTITQVDLAGAALFGTRRRHLLGRRMVQFVQPPDRERWHHYLLAVSKYPGCRDCDLRLLRSDGNGFRARLSGDGARSPDGQVTVRLSIKPLPEHDRQAQPADEQELRLLVSMQAMAGGLYDWDRRSGSLYWNNELANVCGARDGGAAPNRLWWRERVHPEDLRLVRSVFARALKTPVSHVQLTYRMRGSQRGDAPWTYVSDRVLIVRDGSGRVARLVGSITDITARKTAETALLRLNEALEKKVAVRTMEAEARAQALAEAERFARATIDALSCRLCVLDERGRIIATNKAWHECRDVRCSSEYRHNACHGCPALACLVPYLAPDSASEMRRAVRELLGGVRQSFSLEYKLQLDSDVRWFEMCAMRFPGDGPVQFVVTHDDITERIHAAEEQKRSTERLKQLRAHLEFVREHQSAMIARELHDELGATLTMLRLGLATTADAADDPDTVRNRLQALITQVDMALHVVKRVSSSLRPATLDMLGLVATIRWYVAQFSRNTDIAAVLRLPEYVRLSPVGSTTVFRIVQEGLTNVARHSGASKVIIHAREHLNTLIVRLSDNGAGITREALLRPDSFGMMGMRERAEHLGGRLAVHSTPKRGTCLTLRIPLDRAPPDTAEEDSSC